MEVRDVPPESLVVSEMNERTTPPVTDALADSVRKQGVVQPPIAREVTDRSRPGEFEVVVGQRRMLAAQKAGLDTLPVVVATWNDADALEASITENINSFREDVSDAERAAAVERLMDLHDESQRSVAKRLGVDHAAVRDWLEGTREEWEGTDVEPGFKRQKRQELVGSDSPQGSDIYSEAEAGAEELAASVSGSTLRSIRSATGGGEEGEEMAHRVARGELSQSDVRDIASDVNDSATAEREDASDAGGSSSTSVPEGATRVGSADSETVTEATDGSISVQLDLTGDYSERIESRAEADGVSNDEVVRRALREYLGIQE